MSGPRVTSGADSRQDFSTPSDFLAARVKRFGPIDVDLAAHAGNAKHARYFAPAVFVEKVERGKTDLNLLIDDLVVRGANAAEARTLAFEQWAGISDKGSIRIPNRDARAAALDAFAQDWSTLGSGWLNCEFGDIAPWAEKCGKGGESTLLTPASVGSNWMRDHVFGIADVYLLSGRLCFDGKNVFPKDCALSHFHAGATGTIALWDWKRDEIRHLWTPNVRGAEVGQVRLFR